MHFIPVRQFWFLVYSHVEEFLSLYIFKRLESLIWSKFQKILKKNSKQFPKNSEKIPKYSEKIPKNSKEISKNSGEIPKIFQNWIPNY